MKKKIKPGMLVRYVPEWCAPSERGYIHVVIENRLNPVTSEMSRWLIETLNTNLFLNPQETVEEEMIEAID